MQYESCLIPLFYLLVIRCGCDGSNVAEGLDWDRFYMVGRGVLLGLVPILKLQENVQ